MGHEWRIDEREYRRHEARRGRRHAYERLEPSRTALVVVDMIPFFLDENPYARGIVPNVNLLGGALRERGGIVAWVLPATRQPTTAMVEFFGPDVATTYASSAGDSTLRERLAPELAVQRADLVVEKTSPGAFFPGHCDLHGLLRERRIDTVLVTGTVANVCCESTAREASTLGYRTIMVADANAARVDADLNATLHTIYRSFGDVRTTAELLGMIGDGRA